MKDLSNVENSKQLPCVLYTISGLPSSPSWEIRKEQCTNTGQASLFILKLYIQENSQKNQCNTRCNQNTHFDRRVTGWDEKNKVLLTRVYLNMAQFKFGYAVLNSMLLVDVVMTTLIL